jgi:hypothetical protein
MLTFIYAYTMFFSTLSTLSSNLIIRSTTGSLKPMNQPPSAQALPAQAPLNASPPLPPLLNKPTDGVLLVY